MKNCVLVSFAIIITSAAMAQNRQLPVVNVNGHSLQVLNMDAAGRMPWGG